MIWKLSESSLLCQATDELSIAREGEFLFRGIVWLNHSPSTWHVPPPFNWPPRTLACGWGSGYVSDLLQCLPSPPSPALPPFHHKLPGTSWTLMSISAHERLYRFVETKMFPFWISLNVCVSDCLLHGQALVYDENYVFAIFIFYTQKSACSNSSNHISRSTGSSSSYSKSSSSTAATRTYSTSWI